ncbi:MAG: hypothetical protein ACQEVA_02980 [Myxococcota bacterium]
MKRLPVVISLFALVLVLSGCDRGPASVVLKASDFDQSCETDSDCVLVPAGEQCGPCPACPTAPISIDGEPEFRQALSQVDCRTTESGAQCEPCKLREPYCDQGTCKAREPQKEDESEE